MIDAYTKQEIDKIAYELLKSSKALDKFPTPVDEIIAHAELLVEMGVDLSKIENGFLQRFNLDFSKIFAKIRGILDRKEKKIYLDLSQPVSRRNFVKLHEAGHHLLPWQKETFDCLDNQQTLSHDVREQFEVEANYFASVVLFQHDRFQQQMCKLDLSIGAPLALAKTFGASNHATMRKFVETSTKRCALLVLKKPEVAVITATYTARDYFQSEKFTYSFGEIAWPEQFGYNWAFVKDYTNGRRMKMDGMIVLLTKNGEQEFEYHFFNTTWNGFVLIFPKNENRKSKVTYILKGK
ncbi:ImmA/IrrE family metallo-endopeptidase [Chitinophaga oryziterrae]|uniref:ImmA/IrrE family metallo-endopeptidase n=1 Tax=Chitinophaga oryziterrae TaxID=1031224 RepID=A0A6N8J5L9_9BACT|nr:ImmA/IrrE family metallo-endopeptidase [Chitinophaga oryziterrae]MVT40224.1 ImmA/IrrE family metallo-endopeptidase [Chitinophaga oryziterrae]